jgi:hypothetical protein
MNVAKSLGPSVSTQCLSASRAAFERAIEEAERHDAPKLRVTEAVAEQLVELLHEPVVVVGRILKVLEVLRP